MHYTIRFGFLCLAAVLALTTSAKAQFGLYTPHTPAPWTLPQNLPPLSYFDGDNWGDPATDNRALINSYLLTYLSDSVYSDGVYSPDAWEDELSDRLSVFGATNVEFYAHPWTGAEVAAVETSDSLIIVHRGSYFFGTGYLPVDISVIDWYYDLDDDAIQRNIGGLTMYVHEGFWHTSNSVFGWVKDKALTAHLDGKYVWVTGHSLGGANATLSAARLHYDEGIPVQGLQTFGSPKVGDVNLVKLFTENGTDGTTLQDRTQRWVVDGDVATTLFLRDRIFRWRRWLTIYYHHVGQANEILRSPSSQGWVYGTDYDTGDNSTNMHVELNSLLSGGEHGAYTPGLEAEMIDRLTGGDMDATLDDILDGI